MSCWSSLLALDVLMCWLSVWSSRVDRLLSDAGPVLIEDGEMHSARLTLVPATDDDILERA